MLVISVPTVSVPRNIPCSILVSNIQVQPRESSTVRSGQFLPSCFHYPCHLSQVTPYIFRSNTLVALFSHSLHGAVESVRNVSNMLPTYTRQQRNPRQRVNLTHNVFIFTAYAD